MQFQGYYDYAMAYDTSSGETEFKFADLVVQSDLDGPVNFLAGFNVSEATSSSIYDVYFSTADAAAIAPILAGQDYILLIIEMKQALMNWKERVYLLKFIMMHPMM